MKANNVKAKAPASLADRYSAGHKAISVVLSVVLLGFGWPAVNPSQVYAEDGVASTAATTETQAVIDGGVTNSADANAAAGDASAAAANNSASAQAASTDASATSAADNSSQNATSGANAAASNGATAATDAAEPASYDVQLKLNNASLQTVAASAADVQVINPPSSKVTVPAKKDFKFTVNAANGYKLDKVTLTIAGVERQLTADAQGIYTIAADSLAADMSLELVTSEDTEAATQAATNSSDATPIDQIDDGDIATQAAGSSQKVVVDGVEYDGVFYMDTNSDIDLPQPDSEGGWKSFYCENWNTKNLVTVTDYNGHVKSWENEGFVVVECHYSSSKYGWKEQVQRYLVVIGKGSPEVAKSLALTGPDTVEQFNTIDLTATLTPAQDGGTYSWSSDDESILTVDKNGKVTGVSKGTTTVTVTWTSADGNTTLTATKDVTVTASKASSITAYLFFQNSPTANPDSNGSAEWFPAAGAHELGVKINTQGATFNGKNTYDNVANRIVSWPDGSTGSSWVIQKSSKYWELVYKAWKSTLEKEQGTTITEADVEEISIIPYKISKNNCGYHLDCKTVVKCSKAVNAIFYLQDVNATGFAQYDAQTYKLQNGTASVAAPSTAPQDTKMGADGVMYKFMGWYSDQACTQKVTFPQTVNANANYYAKYIPMNQSVTVNYYLEGTTTSVAPSKTIKGWEGQRVNESPKSIEGYTPVSTDAVTAVVGTDDEINFYYRANPVDYTVEYYWNGTDTKIADSETHTGAFGAWTGEIAPKDIDGYTPVSKDAKNITLKADAAQNVIKFYYYKNVTLTANSSTGTGFVYNGKEQEVTGYESSDKSAEFDDVTARGAGTDAGTYPVNFAEGTMGKVSRDGKYVVSELVPGSLYISKYTNEVVVKVKGHSDTLTYDGAQHTVQGYDATATNCDFYNATYISYSGEASIAQADVLRNGTGSVKAYTLALDASKFSNTNANFTNVKFVVEGGLSLTINPKSVTLKSADLAKEYDGMPLTNGDAELETNDGFVEGQGVTCSFTGSQVAAGSSSNAFTYEPNEGTNLNNYAISKTEGQLTVSDRKAQFEITVKAVSNAKATNKYNGTDYEANGIEGVVYDGTEQSGTTFTIGSASFTVKGLTTSNPKERNAGEYANEISGTVQVVDAYGNDVTKQFKVNTENGKLVIGKRQVTLTSGTASKQYDGTALTNHDVTISGDGFLATQTPSQDDYVFKKDDKPSEQTTVGSSENYFTYNPASSVIKDNYEFTYIYGNLEVTESEAPVVVTVTMNSDKTPVYDGAEHSVSGYSVANITLNGEATSLYTKDDFKFNGSALTKTDAGEYDYNASATDFENTNASFKNVEFVVIPGKLSIAKKDVTMTSESDSKVYDGAALTNNIITAEGFVGNDGAQYAVTGTQTNVGSSANGFTYTLNNGVNENNYSITSKYGTLTVTPQSIDPSKNASISVEAPSNTKYNGTDQKREPVVKSGDTVLVKDVDYTLSYSDDVKNVGAVTVTVTGKGNYEDTATCTYQITKRDVVLTSGTNTWTYDGNNHSEKTVTASGDDFAMGEGASYNNFATVNAVASDVENAFDYTLNEGTLAGNYNITKVLGKLDIVAKSVTADGMQVEPLNDVVYNGSEQKLEPVVKDGSTVLVKDRDYTLSYSEDVTNVGKVTVTVTGMGNYAGTTTVDYQITKRDVVVASNDRTWTYDGNAHGDSEVVILSYYGFVGSDVTSMTATGSITNPGTQTNTIDIVFAEGKAGNYNVTKHEGALTVNAKDLNAADMNVGQLSDVVYNGQDQAQYPTVTDGGKTLIEGTDYEISFSGDIKNVTNAGVTVTITGKGNYKGSVERTYRITPAKLTVKTQSDSRAYNGQDLTAGGSIDGFVNDESAAFAVTGKQNSVGSSVNTYEINWEGATASKGNYNIDEQLGTLTITESSQEIVVTTVGGSYTYNGLTHEPVVTVSNLPEGYTVQSAVSNTTAKDVNTDADGKGGVAVTADTLVILNAAGEDVTANLNIKKIDGTLAITPARVVVNTPSASKVYDGQALTAEGSISGLVEGETVDFKTTGTQTEQGASDNSYELNWTGSAKESNYTVEASVGKLSVSKQSITPGEGEQPSEDYKGVTIDDPSDVKYDGGVHQWVPVVKDANDTELVAGIDYQVTYNTDNFKDVKTIEVTIEGIGNYTGKVTKSYKITPRTVVLKSNDGSWTYDGNSHQNTKIDIDGDGFVSGEGVTYKDFATVKDVASNVENTFGYDWNEGTLAGNYSVEQTYGKLSVTKAKAEGNITLEGKDATKVYDGDSISAAAATATVGFGNSVKIEYSTDQVNWTENPADISITDVVDSKTVYLRASSEANYDGYVYATEKLSVTPKAVTVETGTATKTYDGKALTAAGGISGIVDGETYDFQVTGSRTEKGTSDNTYSLKWNDGTAGGAGYTAKASNYTVNPTVGTLTVNERSIADTEYGMVVNSPSNIEYDGLAHQWAPTVTDNGKTLVAGTDYDVAYSTTDFTNVTDVITVTITGKGNYAGTVTKEYQITPTPLTVTTEGANKVYNGEALTHDVASVVGLKNNETATIHATGSQTAVGSSDNTYSITWDGTADQSNYVIKSVTLGKLVVTQSENEIVATPQNVTATYDGQPHGTTVDVAGVPEGYSVKAAASNATATNVADGTVIANVDDLVIENAQGIDVTDQLNITRNTGTIAINPAALTVTTEGATKEYDGTALTNGKVDVSGFVNGESAQVETTGAITEVGTTSNGYTLDWGAVDSRNYSVSENLGTLEITPSNAAVAITSASDSKVYDGSALTANGATATGLPAGFTVAISTKASQTDAGTADNTIDSYQIFNAEGKDVTSMFASVSTTAGTLAVSKKDVAVTTEGASKVFDGAALTNNNGSIDGLVQGETATVQPNGTQTAVGSSSNSYGIVWGTAKEANYNVASSTLGTLAVTPQSVNPEDSSYKGILVDDPSNATYDGAQHTWTPKVTDANGNELTPGTDYDVTFDTNDFTNAGTITATITGKGNYTGAVTKSYTIAKAKVSIATQTADKVYDGTALTAGGEIAGLVNNETVDFAATGSQTAVGSSQNGYRLAWTGTAKESNYEIESVSLGTLTVKQSEDEIVVTTVGGTFTYDGQAHGATVTVSTLPEGYTLESASSNATATDANGEGVEATANNLVIRNAAGQDVTSDLNITYVNGTIVVKPAELTVSTGSASKVFDGSALTAAGSIEGFVNGEEATFAVTGSQTEVGQSQNGYELAFDKSAKAGNYVVASEDLGTLEVTAQSITPGEGDQPDASYHGIAVSDPEDVAYDNAQHRWTPVVTDANGTALVEGVDYEVSYNTDDFVDAGEISAIITGIGNYKGSVVKSYRIIPVELVVTTGSATKTYDGTALTSAELSIEGLKGADAVAARTTGEQTEVGSSENTYTIDWREVNPNNYVVTEQLGTLTVEPAPVVPTPGTDQPGDNPQPGTTPDGGTTPGTTPGATDTATNGDATPAGPIEALAQALESGYEAVTGDTSASAPEEQIYDEQNPLGKAEPETCWVHFYMILGMLLTALYGVLVWLRRGNHTRKLRNDMNDILDGGNGDSKESPAVTGQPATEA